MAIGPAIGWTATMGLVPGYAHDNMPDGIEERRALLIRTWTEAMEKVNEETGYSISVVMTPSIVIYPRSGGCPEGGEQAMTLTGSSNPKFVKPRDFYDFAEAVERIVRFVQTEMEQTSVRIEFSEIRSIYSRVPA